MGVTFKNCGFPRHLKHLLGAWYTVIFFFSFVKWVDNEIILTEFVLNCSHMLGASFQRVKIKQTAMNHTLLSI